jgi:predicted AlkP superfamily pyrophosphatase or phosphodiesterase
MVKFKHVALIGIDGAGDFFSKTETPNLDRIFADGAVGHRVLTSIPTISAECWGSMLIGVTPEVHGLTNDIVSARPYPVDSPYPTLFRVIREQNPGAVLASFCNWGPINSGIIESDIGVYKEIGGDEPLCDKICGYVRESRPEMLFVQFDEVDGAGHCYGYGTERYYDQIKVEDRLIGKIYEAYREAGILDDTLFLVTADHGGEGHNHGGTTDEEKYVMFAACGHDVKHTDIKDMVIRDTASLCVNALGYRQPESWDSKFPAEIFE